MRLHALLSTAGPGAAAQRGAKAGAAAAERFQTKQAITEALFVSEALQHLQRRSPVGEQAIEMLLVREINLTGIDTCGRSSAAGAELLLRRSRLLNSGCSLINRASSSSAPSSPAVRASDAATDAASRPLQGAQVG